jgi:hypothetical protein
MENNKFYKIRLLSLIPHNAFPDNGVIVGESVKYAACTVPRTCAAPKKIHVLYWDPQMFLDDTAKISSVYGRGLTDGRILYNNKTMCVSFKKRFFPAILILIFSNIPGFDISVIDSLFKYSFSNAFGLRINKNAEKNFDLGINLYAHCVSHLLTPAKASTLLCSITDYAHYGTA